MQAYNKSNNFNLNSETNLQNAYMQIVNLFKESQIEDAVFEANYLVNHVTGKDRRIFAQEKLSAQQAEKLTQLAQKRSLRYPLQYLIGEWEFLDFTLKIGEGVLIPRQDTQTVCEQAICCAKYLLSKKSKEQQSLESMVSVVDLCSGSGAIAIGVAKNVKQANVTAVELYDDAYKYLVQNVENLAPKINTVQGNVFNWQNTLSNNSIDILVCNPPYITKSEMNNAQPELNYEPITALMAENEGLLFYEHIAKEYKSKIKSGGFLIFEIGSTQAQSVKNILIENAYTEIEVIKDDFTLDRCIKAIAK